MSTEDAWERYERDRFGRSPTTDDLLDRYLNRTGARRSAQQDPAATLQVALLRDFLRVLHAALDDEHIDPTISRRVVERVIYGGTPSPAEVEQRIAERTRMVEYLACDTRPTLVVGKPPADTSWIRSTETP